MKILQNADGAVFLFRGATQPGDITGVILMAAVRKIQTRYIHAHAHHFSKHGFGVTGGSDGANDLGPPGGRDGEVRGKLSRDKIQFARFQVLPVFLYDFVGCVVAGDPPAIPNQALPGNARPTLK